MNRLTKRIDGSLVFPSELIGVVMTPSNDAMCQILTRLAAYEDTGLEPEDVRRLQQDWTSLIMTLDEMGGMPHLHELVQAKQDGRLVVLDEKVVLSMCAGARAIENNKRLFGVTYGYDIFGVCGGPKEISYYDAAKKLREIAEPVLDREDTALAGKGGDG